jgi:threonine/homoserine/homoserine lactone efflux protein
MYLCYLHVLLVRSEIEKHKKTKEKQRKKKKKMLKEAREIFFLGLAI